MAIQRYTIIDGLVHKHDSVLLRVRISLRGKNSRQGRRIALQEMTGSARPIRNLQEREVGVGGFVC